MIAVFHIKQHRSIRVARSVERIETKTIMKLTIGASQLNSLGMTTCTSAMIILAYQFPRK